MRARTLTAVAMATALTLVIAATALAATASPKVSAVWARTSSAENGAVYMTITGAGSADKLVKASVPMSVAHVVQIHKSSMDASGMMTMTQVKSVAVPARGSVKLKPGGYHVMLMMLRKPLKAGQAFPVTLTFAKAGTVKVTATVRAS